MSPDRHPAPCGPARRRRAAVALAATLLLSGCTQIPQASGVRSSEPLDGRQPSADVAQFRPPGPAADADAAGIIRGFIQAGTGPQEDYAVAREYLTDAARTVWNPARRTVIYSAEPTITRAPGAGAYQIQVEVDSEVDEFGLRTVAPPGTTQAWKVTVEDGPAGPRISAVDDGTLVSLAQFTQVYAPHELVFYDQTMTYAVPDLRWFVNRGSTVPAVTRALLRGPAPYLAGAVTTAFPLRSGADLTRPVVPVDDDGTAHVDLSLATVEGADAERRFRMQEQLGLTLTGLTSVRRVEVTVEDSPLTVSGGVSAPPPVKTDPAAGSVQIGVDPGSGALAFFQGLSVTPVGGLADVSGLEPVDPAMSRDRTAFAFLTDDRRSLRVATTAGGLREVLRGSDLSAPSLDALGWAWTVERGRQSRVHAVPLSRDGGSTPRAVTVPWLEEGESVLALRISRGGARAAMVIDDGTRRTVRVAGVVRGSDGVPTSLTEPVLLPTYADPQEVAWMGKTSLVVTDLAATGTDRITPEVVSLDGTTRRLNPLTGLTGISPGDDGTLYAETRDAVFLLVGSSWRAQELTQPIRDLAFPG